MRIILKRSPRLPIQLIDQLSELAAFSIVRPKGLLGEDVESDPMRLNVRLGLGFGALIAIIFVLGWAGYYSASRNSQAIHEVASNQLPGVQALLTMNLQGNIVKTAQRTLLNPDINEAVRQRQAGFFAKARESYEAAEVPRSCQEDKGDGQGGKRGGGQEDLHRGNGARRGGDALTF